MPTCCYTADANQSVWSLYPSPVQCRLFVPSEPKACLEAMPSAASMMPSSPCAVCASFTSVVPASSTITRGSCRCGSSPFFSRHSRCPVWSSAVENTRPERSVTGGHAHPDHTGPQWTRLQHDFHRHGERLQAARANICCCQCCEAKGSLHPSSAFQEIGSTSLKRFARCGEHSALLRTGYAEGLSVVRLAEMAAPHVGDALRPVHGDAQLCATP